MELIGVTAAQRSGVENRITDLCHGPSRFPPDLLVQARWVLTLGSCCPDPRQTADKGGVKVSSLAFQSMRNGCIKPTVNEVVTPGEFKLSAELLVPRIVPSRAHHAARGGVHFGDKEMKVELGCRSVVTLLPVPKQHDALRVEAELLCEEVKRSQLLLRRDVGLG